MVLGRAQLHRLRKKSDSGAVWKGPGFEGLRKNSLIQSSTLEEWPFRAALAIKYQSGFSPSGGFSAPEKDFFRSLNPCH